MGIDQIPEVDQKSVDQFSGRSDTMLLVRLDPDEQNVNVLSIPRDTQVEIPSVGVVKINQANVVGGPALASEVVSHALSDVPIDRYVRIDTSAFRDLVDLLGGVEVFVPQRMFYEDQTQKLKIDLQPGWQTLNGVQAEQFARFRQDQHGDIGRVQRQQILLKAIQKRLINPLMLTRLPQAFSLVQKHLDTNLSVGEMLALAQFGLRLGNPDHLNMVLLPGRFSQPGEYNASYWIMDPNGVERVMRNYFQVSAIESSGSSEYEADPTLQSLKIAVQNASSNPQAGQQMVRYLADQGFGNVYLDGNWPDSQDQTQVIAQRGDLDAARTLEAALGVGRVRADSTGSLDSDLTIRVGEDWTRIKPIPPL
jgi:LCP family protein required for cell wall assembly